MGDGKRFELTCAKCGHVTVFDQPYPYHGGFSDQFFLYNDDGNLTLVWSSWDQTFEPAMGVTWLGKQNEDVRARLEASLPAAPKGGRWRFGNPARCAKCRSPISGAMGETVYYVLFPDSLVVRSLSEAADRLGS